MVANFKSICVWCSLIIKTGCELLTDNLKVPLSTPHRVCVHLTHVPPSISLAHFPDVQSPRSVVVVRQRYPRVLGDDSVVNGQNRLGVNSDPRHLKQRKTNLDTSEPTRWTTLGYLARCSLPNSCNSSGIPWNVQGFIRSSVIPRNRIWNFWSY